MSYQRPVSHVSSIPENTNCFSSAFRCFTNALQSIFCPTFLHDNLVQEVENGNLIHSPTPNVQFPQISQNRAIYEFRGNVPNVSNIVGHNQASSSRTVISELPRVFREPLPNVTEIDTNRICSPTTSIFDIKENITEIYSIKYVIWADVKPQIFISSEKFREEAKIHIQRNQDLKKIGNSLLQSDRKTAHLYFKKAKNELLICKQLNAKAAATILIENFQRKPMENTIDLHGLFVKEALEALHFFLYKSITLLVINNEESKKLCIITGRGKHSPQGIAKIKPAIIKRLQNLNLSWEEINPGSIQTEVYSNTYLGTF